jgi:hypothetical protein
MSGTAQVVGPFRLETSEWIIAYGLQQAQGQMEQIFTCSLTQGAEDFHALLR